MRQTKKKSESEKFLLHFSNPNLDSEREVGKIRTKTLSPFSCSSTSFLNVMTLDVVARYDIFISSPDKEKERKEARKHKKAKSN